VSLQQNARNSYAKTNEAVPEQENSAYANPMPQHGLGNRSGRLVMKGRSNRPEEVSDNRNKCGPNGFKIRTVPYELGRTRQLHLRADQLKELGAITSRNYW
jgi:hypothetical protein